jgi:hypothetical protein
LLSGASTILQILYSRIRCPDCAPANLNKPGFIKDQGGKYDSEGRARRLWGCQRSNSRAAKQNCRRITCTEFIDLARQQLEEGEFGDALVNVCEEYPPEQEEYAGLKGYLTAWLTSHTTSQSTTATLDLESSPILPKKRKAEEELPFVAKTARYYQDGEESNGIRESLRTTLLHLQSMIEMSRGWQKQYDMLTAFLSTSSLASAPPSSTIHTWTSPGWCLKSPPPPSATVGSSPKSVTPRAPLLLDTVIPSTYPEEELTSPAPAPQFSVVQPSDLSLKHSSTQHPIVYPSTPDPRQVQSGCVKRATELVEQFNQSTGQERKKIRDQARREGVWSYFQSILNKSKKKTALPRTPEPKCSDLR